MADKNEITLIQVAENFQNQLTELKKFLKQEGESNQEHYQRLTDICTVNYTGCSNVAEVAGAD